MTNEMTEKELPVNSYKVKIIIIIITPVNKYEDDGQARSGPRSDGHVSF